MIFILYTSTCINKYWKGDFRNFFTFILTYIILYTLHDRHIYTHTYILHTCRPIKDLELANPMVHVSSAAPWTVMIDRIGRPPTRSPPWDMNLAWVGSMIILANGQMRWAWIRDFTTLHEPLTRSPAQKYESCSPVDLVRFLISFY